MAVHEGPIEELKKAYRVLDVPETASALAIKANYRKLIKRWHPDRPATGAATAAEATMMTKLINEAYARIENAPLRYYAGAEIERPAPARDKHGAGEKRRVESLSDAEVARIEKRVEYTVRIICGVLAGAFIGFLFVGSVMQSHAETFSSSVFFALLFGAGAVRVGDKVWREIFLIWWKWR